MTTTAYSLIAEIERATKAAGKGLACAGLQCRLSVNGRVLFYKAGKRIYWADALLHLNKQELAGVKLPKTCEPVEPDLGRVKPSWRATGDKPMTVDGFEFVSYQTGVSRFCYYCVAIDAMVIKNNGKRSYSVTLGDLRLTRLAQSVHNAMLTAVERHRANYRQTN